MTSINESNQMKMKSCIFKIETKSETSYDIAINVDLMPFRGVFHLLTLISNWFAGFSISYEMSFRGFDLVQPASTLITRYFAGFYLVQHKLISYDVCFAAYLLVRHALFHSVACINVLSIISPIIK